jgi:putative tricarboxylic transport membrane protein
MVLIAIVALILKALDFPLAPMLLGFILGGYLEDNLQRALILYDGSLRFLWERPASLVILIMTALLWVKIPLTRIFWNNK